MRKGVSSYGIAIDMLSLLDQNKAIPFEGKKVRRRQLIEFTDIPWWPKALRGLLTDFLRTFIGFTQPFSSKIHLIVKALDATKQTNIVDLCSGTGGPWGYLASQLRDESGRDIQVVLTDRFPDSLAIGDNSVLSGVSYHEHSVDALNVPKEFDGVRTLFDGFHHFPPAEAQGILKDAIDNQCAIVIFEILQRNWLNIIGALTAPIAVWLITPFIRPFSFSRLLLTYVIPIAPLVITWDSIVSQARCYTPDELLMMARNAGGDNYHWDTGTYRSRGVPVTYLVGYPRTIVE